MVTAAAMPYLGFDIVSAVKRPDAPANLNRLAMSIVRLPSDRHVECTIDTGANSGLNGRRVRDNHYPSESLLANQLLEDEGTVAGRTSPDVVARIEKRHGKPGRRHGFTNSLGGVGQTQPDLF